MPRTDARPRRVVGIATAATAAINTAAAPLRHQRRVPKRLRVAPTLARPLPLRAKHLCSLEVSLLS